MAVTSIWPIKGRVDKVINYARNPEKTHDKEKLSELHEIEGVVEYAADEMKTEKRAYVTCLNLHSEETAAQEFMETKRLMHNEGGRSCYHGYQSFKADEVDADTAHSIGVALARELWGDRFQVVIATHCNTGHYHNHFVINSVSDVDGKKFYNSPADYRRMREVSDRLCREAKISVIECPADRRANYGEWLAEKNGKPKNADSVEPLSMDEIRALADQALKVIPERVKYYAPKVGVTYGRITIRNQRSKWGSCSGKGNLNFNCLLMLTPPEVLDSVVVHELCHRKEMNHSEKFYSEVLRVFPDYWKWDKWLKENGNLLMMRMTK